jgi:DNA-binding transcriptional LysR family regulator
LAGSRRGRNVISISVIRLFVRIAECGGIAPAARAFGTPPSVASRQIAALEQALGTKLLIRTTRRLSLTQTGATFLDWAHTTTTSFEELCDEIGAMQHRPAGTVRLAANDYAATTLLPPVLGEFCRLYPDIRLKLTTSNDPVALLKHDCELALHGGRAPDVDFICRRVLTYQRRLCASPAYMSGRVPLASIADLAVHNCITHVHGERTAWSFEHNGLITTQAIEPYIECDNFQSIVQLVHAGLGIGRLAEALVGPEIEKGTLIDILPAYRCVYPDGGVAGTWLLFANRRILFRTRLLADFIARTLGGS